METSEAVGETLAPPASVAPNIPARESGLAGTADVARGRMAAVAGLFFVTGATGLIYEVLWTRQLLYIFGATIYAVSTVLSAFMGGLALGSWAFGRWADTRRNPFRVYGVLEILIGAAAFSLPFMLRALDPVFQAMYDHLRASFLVFSLIRFALVFALLLIPTTIMGATLPMLSRYLARRADDIGARVGLLYTLNTFGAVVGCFLSGFVLIEHLGLRKTTLLAVSLNGLVGLAAIILSRKERRTPNAERGIEDKEKNIEYRISNKECRREEKATDQYPTLRGAPNGNKEYPSECGTAERGVRNAERGTTSDSRSTIHESRSTIHDSRSTIHDPLSTPSYPAWVPKAVLWTYAVSGGIALTYQVLWSRALVFAMDVMKNTTYAFTAMLTVFLIGLALGSAIMSRVIDRQRDPLRLYGLIQILIGLGGALSLYVILYRARGMQLVDCMKWEEGRVIWIGAVINTFWQTFAGIFAPTLMMGMAFPVAARLYVGDVRRIGGEVGRLYAMNTVGAIIGSFVGGFVIIPLLGMGRGIMALAVVNIAMGVGLIGADPFATVAARRLYAALGAVILLLLLARFPSLNQPFQDFNPRNEQLVFYDEGPLATVSVVENKMTRHRTILVDNVGVAGTDPVLMTDQKSLAHIPVLFHPNPRSALTVGFGSGGASHSYCLYDFMERIHCAEICDTVLKAAPDLTASNHGVITFDRPDRKGPPVVREDARGRYAIKLDDVRSYLRFTKERYDIIATDCTDLKYKSNSNLYDLEYFQLCADHVNEDGLVVVWMPLGGLSDETFRAALRTFYRVFPKHFSVWYMNNEPTHYVLLIGAKRPLHIDVEQVKRRLADPKVSADLAEIGLADAYKLLSCYVVDQRNLEDFLKGDILNTEDFPYLEFQAPRYGFGDQPLLDNLARLWLVRNDVNPYLANWAGATDPKEADLLKRYAQAADAILKGNEAFRKLDMEEAARQYLRAREICPEDPSVKRLLEFRELVYRVANMPGDLWGLVQLGHVLMMQERHDEALDYLRRAVALEKSEQPRRSDALAQSLFKQAREELGKCEAKLVR